MDNSTLGIIIVTALCITISIWHFFSNHCKSSKHYECYLIDSENQLINGANDSSYIIEKIGYFVGEGSKHGLNSIDIRVDLRCTQVSNVYKAIGVIQSQDGITISEKEKGPATMLLNVEWAELQNITA